MFNNFVVDSKVKISWELLGNYGRLENALTESRIKQAG